jgi:acyl-CoA synthetase (AMP-forming)/AMP-acid ligase II
VPEVEIKINAGGREGSEVTGDEPVRAGSGEIMVRGTVVTDGYWLGPQDSKPAIDDEGWFATGDIGRFDEDGFLYIVDRVRDVIISGGFTVYPSEVERAVRATAGVADAAVFGLPDERWGETVVAVVVPDPEGPAITAEAVIASCRDQLADYKKPRRVIFAERLPLTGNGKVDRRALQDAAPAQLG